mmetsp:Transcript_12556/g.20922  ORF Transcript_12556/g.20922 Transcript_12556/m.20922 type:complete len:83 (+) Transcript_12556:1017-1265(+)
MAVLDDALGEDVSFRSCNRFNTMLGLFERDGAEGAAVGEDGWVRNRLRGMSTVVLRSVGDSGSGSGSGTSGSGTSGSGSESC